MKKLKFIILFVLLKFVCSRVIRKTLVNVHIIGKKAKEDFIRVDIEEPGKVYQLNLQPLDNIWSKNSKITTVTSDEKETQVFEDMSLFPYSVYRDSDSGAILGIDGDRVNGIIGDSLVIKSEEDEHYIYQSDSEFVDYVNDYLIPPTFITDDYKSHNFQLSSNEFQNASYAAEVVVVVDSVLASKFSDNNEIYKYLTIFWNAVNERYATIERIQFRVALVGSIIFKSSDVETFIISNLYNNDNSFYLAKTIYDFSDWIYQNYGKNKDILPSFDFAYLQTGRNLVGGDGNKDLAGLAWVGAACPSLGQVNASYYATGLGEDLSAFYDGVFTAAHEAAHNFGAPHDGEAATKDCHWKDGYIMSYIAGTINRLYFSSCSINKIIQFAQSAKGACLSNEDNSNPYPSSVSSDILPGHILNSLHETCQLKTSHLGAMAHDPSNCYQLKCRKPVGEKFQIWVYSIPPPEGVECEKDGSAGRCRNGICDIDAHVTNDEQEVTDEI